MQDEIPQDLCAVIRHTVPGLRPLRLIDTGFDSRVVEAEGPDNSRSILKFPRDEQAAARLRTEAALLAEIAPHLSLQIPQMQVFDGPPMMSLHRKIEGETLDPPIYAAASPAQRDRLAADLARFYAEMHALRPRAGPVIGFVSEAEIRRIVLPLLPQNERRHAGAILTAFAALPPDPLPQVFGFFDGHGWNMAFDAGAGRLNGLFDFADAGYGGVHHDLMHTNLISPDLTPRLCAAYSTITGRAVDLRRISILTGMHRLSDLAEAHDHPQNGALVWQFWRDWLNQPESRAAYP